MARFDDAAWQEVMHHHPFGSLDWEDPEVQRLANMREGERLPYIGLSAPAKPMPSAARRLDIEILINAFNIYFINKY